ncbi:tyrosine--tRNA ligase [Candidatus Dojkabacteria bacterium]|nr:tyrosine--tRNA ligase [Candidatus Dojkabacteria bacterium]
MKFTVEKDIFKKFPNAKFGGLFILGLNNNRKSENIERILSQYCKSIKGEKNRLNRKKIYTWDNLFLKIGLDSKNITPSHKALLKRAISSGEIPNISPLVNVYNFISLKYTLPIGGHDIDKVKEVVVGQTTGNETFLPMNTEEIEEVPKNEYAYLDKKNQKVLTRNLVWRQADTDKITKETTNVFIPIDDIPGNFGYEEIEKIAMELATIICEELGGKSYFGIVNKYKTKLDSDKLPELQMDPKIPNILLKKRMDVVTDEKKINEVLTKGVKEIFPEKEDLKKLMMSGKRLKLYTGIDPTANFIHMGHIIWMKKLAQFQKLGHEVIFLIGAFTAMIGDPDKQYTREPLTKEKVRQNFKNYKKDASKILDFDWEKNPVQILNNFDWLSRLNLEDWLTVMSKVTMQHILSHDMFRQRIENENPIRLHEVMYPLMQGYDSVHMEVDLEVGGSDQTFNMLTGRILERNILGKEKFVLTLKLLTDNTGTKMGKTTNNAISFKDNPNDCYGKVMSFSDEVTPLAYELLSKKSLSEIEKIKEEIDLNPMKVKKELAFELTTLIHSKEKAEEAATYFQEVIQNQETPDDIPEFRINELADKPILNIIDLLEKTKLVDSRGQAKRLVKQGGVRVNDKKIKDIHIDIKLKEDTIVQAGKRNWVKLI